MARFAAAITARRAACDQRDRDQRIRRDLRVHSGSVRCREGPVSRIRTNHFSTVLCCELLEHLTADPMHMMAEINRILKPGGHLVLTTPNLASLRALAGILQGFHPQLFSAYIRPRNGVVDARHAREYTPVRDCASCWRIPGFEVTLLETGPFREEPKPEFGWVEHLLDRYLLSTELRGDGIYAVGRKAGPVRRTLSGMAV